MPKFLKDRKSENFSSAKLDYESDDSFDGNESDDSLDSMQQDALLQDALLEGKLKPGLHVQYAHKEKKSINKVQILKSKLSDFELDANWIERLDLESNIDSLPAHIPNPLKDENLNKTDNDLDVVRNDIKREIKFMLEAKSSALQGLQRLHSLNVKTKRPDDYFAEMLKTKEHMDKIKKVKDQKKELVDKKEKAKVLREQKKMSKKIQQEVLRERQKEKKEFQEKIKKFKKGSIKTTDFLDDKSSKPGKPGKLGNSSKLSNSGKLGKNKSRDNQLKRNPKLSKKEFKQSKYGQGGRKKGIKRNTKESSASMQGFRSFKKAGTKSKKRFRK